ncbi:ABC transporter permease [Actinomadura rudentiformis]|uniref:ABC transporter permease n=1 Tax=Actinomadura rudentiformis TaxID=359158 RepID=A0A6H9YPF9_9ACTN|nr:ABC transporter permease [Actinomadura rudentiformis]KAB2346846.1 ABC transporter permease [Actinomadura rudentiformis]
MTSLTGTGGLVRLVVRRDRVLLPIWTLLFGLIPISFVASIRDLYPTAADQAKYASTSGTNPTFLALYGQLWDNGIGGIVVQRAGFVPVMLGLVSALTVIRHTRTEEEAGRRELVGATVVGRHAALAAALIVTIAANLVIGALLALGMTGQDLPAAGSAAFGLQLAMAGIVFAAIAGVAAQLTEGSGAARGLALGTLGVLFVVRLAADVGGKDSGLSWLAWLSPLGWGNRLRPYGGEQWWVLALFAVLILALVYASVALSARRDVGAGFLPPRLGPATAARGLSTPLGLAWRLHRAALLGWTVGLGALGVVYGSVAEGVKTMVEDNPDLEKYFTRIGGQEGLIDAFLASSLSILGVIASGYAIQAALRMRTEETSGRAEPVLGTATSRIGWVASHLAFSLLGPTVALLASGLAVGLAHGINSGDVGGQLPRVLGATLVQLPAVWLLTGIALALFGLLPRLTAVAWAALALFFLLGQFGAVLQLSQSVMDVSPFTHIPKLPGGELQVAPLAWLLGLTTILVVAGLYGFRRRDLEST